MNADQETNFLNHIPDLLAHWSSDLIAKSANRAYCDFFGVDSARIVGLSLREIVGEEHYQKSLPMIREVLKGKPQLFERELPSPHRRGFHSSLVRYVPEFADNKVVGFFVMVTDITETKNLEHQYRLVVDTMGEGLVIQNEKAKILQYNPAALQILGLTADQLTGRTSYDPMWRAIREDGSDFPGDEHPAVLALKSKRPVNSVVMGIQLPNGSRRWININARPYALHNPSTGLDSDWVICTFTDVTRVKDREEEIQFALEAHRIGVWKFNPVTQELAWDKSMYRVFDIDPREFSGDYQAWESSLTPEAKEAAVSDLGRALSGEKEFDTIFEIQTRSKGKRHISGKAKIVRDANGNPMMMYGINTDCTAEIHAKQKLKQLLDENLAIIKSAQYAIIVTDLEGTITAFNEAAERVLGYSAAEVVGKITPAQFHDPLEVEKVAQELTQEFHQTVQVGFDTFVFKARRGAADERQWTYIHKNGSRCQVRLIVTTLRDHADQVCGFMGIAKDITADLKLVADLELERAKSLRNSKLASLGEMSAGIAHEINNPLAIIEGSIELLKRYQGQPDKFAAKINAIAKASHRITRIVKSLKKYSRTDDKTVHRAHPLEMIIADALTLTESKAIRHQTKISVDLNANASILCDEIEIEQVLVNMINNSIDAVRTQNDRWVKLLVTEEPTSILLSVMDSGPGISEAVRNKLFTPFFTTKPVGEGTGLGLSITKGILDEHGATIGIREDLPYTCFEIRFPKV